MLNRIKEFFSSKNKLIKISLIVVVIATVIIVKAIDIHKGNDEKTQSPTANSSENTSAKEQSGIHIGIGHIVMIVVFTAAYGIDKIIVYRNNLKDKQKYDNHKE